MKCEGRFNEIVDALEDGLDVLFDRDYTSTERFPITEETLNELFDLTSDDYIGYDVNDPYFGGNGFVYRDGLRPAPTMDEENIALQLVPLVARLDGYFLMPEENLHDKYLEAVGCPEGKLRGYLASFQDNLDLEEVLDLEMKNILVPIKKSSVPAKRGTRRIVLHGDRVRLDGYKLRTSFGMCNLDGDTVVPDCPYSIDIYKQDGEEGEKLALKVGFWYAKKTDKESDQEKDVMVISQIQNAGGVDLPGSDKGSQMGVVGLAIAELIAKNLGFDRIETYSADKHPMFLQYPGRKRRMKGDFTCYFDASAKALGFEGSRTTHYVKDL